ncbi:MAG: hypothetical protein ACYCPS_04500 [Candidatus Saccharimonadales bacterium]
MTKKPTGQTGFSAIEAILILIVIILIGSVAWYTFSHNKKSNPPSVSSINSSSSTSCQFHQSIGCNWYIGAPVLSLLFKANPSLAKQYFDHPTTFVAVTAQSQLSQIPSGWNVTPIYTYFDETQLHSAISGHTLPAAIKGVSLDDELAVCKVYGQNECTPQAEQSNPVPYEQDAAELARQNDLIYLDVGAAPDPINGNNRWHAAAFASYVDSQIQLSQADLSKYTQESNTYLEGWRSATQTYTVNHYPGATGGTAKVIDGITAKVPTCSTGETGCTTYQTATPSSMVDAVKATMNTGIWGYWLNCPSGTTPGPGPCDQSDVSAMETFLQDMLSVY